MDATEWGREGGKTTLERYGKDHFAQLARARWARDKTAKEREAQGLPPGLDPVTIERIADLLADRIAARLGSAA
jgi:hypothetical protein